MGLTAVDKNVYDLLNDKMYHVPENQRRYVWNMDNWKELIEDINLVYTENANKHFIGSIVLKSDGAKNGIKNHYNIIDGQQRILTLTILICSIGLLYFKLGEQGKFYGLKKYLFVNDNENIEHTIISVDANKDIAILVEKIYSCTEKIFSNIHKTTDVLAKTLQVSKIVIAGLKYFYESISTEIKGDVTNLDKYNDIVQDIRYIDIVANEDEDAYTIFEILNARGQALTDFDLLRNFLLKYSNIKDRESVKKGLWEIETLLKDNVEIFLTHYVTHKYGIKSDKKQKRPYKIIVENEKISNKIDFLKDLVLKAKFYDKIINYTDCTPFEKKVFSYFNPRKQRQFRPLVLGLMHQKMIGCMDEKQYNIAIGYLYNFFICFTVIGEQTSNKIEDIVYKYSKEIENNFSDETINQMKASMVKKMPLRDNFIMSIKRICYSNHVKAYSGSSKRGNAAAILELLEQIRGYDGGYDGIEVEHCYPDYMSEENAAIGNLILIEGELNDKCKGKQLRDKINLYKESKLKLPLEIWETYNAKGNFNIKERTKLIAIELYNYIYSIASV